MSRTAKPRGLKFLGKSVVSSDPIGYGTGHNGSLRISTWACMV